MGKVRESTDYPGEPLIPGVLERVLENLAAGGWSGKLAWQEEVGVRASGENRSAFGRVLGNQLNPGNLREYGEFGIWNLELGILSGGFSERVTHSIGTGAGSTGIDRC